MRAAERAMTGKAAATIYGRFEGLFEDNVPRASVAVGFSVQELRAVGLSNNKALSVIDLAEHKLQVLIAILTDEYRSFTVDEDTDPTARR